MPLVLVLNPGASSTKVAVFNGENVLLSCTITHSREVLSTFTTVASQFEFRKEQVAALLKSHHIKLQDIDVVVGRGGMLKPLKSGTYSINQKMLNDLQEAKYGEHASNLGALIASAIAKIIDQPAYTADPVVVDEMNPIARISGIPELPRKSIFHALNHKRVARMAANDLKRCYEELTFIICHMGSGVSVGLHDKGRVVDVNNNLDGEGPFSPERSGGVPVGQLVELCYSQQFTKKEIYKKIHGHGGLVAYLGVTDVRVIAEKITNGDVQSEKIYRALAYQISKEIGALSTVISGKVDAILLTGGMAHDSKFLVPWITDSVSFIAPVRTYAGEMEMTALRDAAMAALNKEISVLEYT